MRAGLLPKELRIINFVFTSKALAKKTMYEELVKYCSSRPRNHWPGFIVDFENYLIMYYEKTPEQKITPYPQLAEEWCVTSESQKDTIVLLFACYLSSQLTTLRKSNAPDLLDYFGVKETKIELLGPVPKYTPWE